MKKSAFLFLFLMVATGHLNSADDQPLIPMAPLVDGEGLQIERMYLLGMTLTDVVTEPEMKGNRLRFNNVRGRAYGGEVQGRVDVILPAGDIHIDLNVTDFDLGKFMHRFAGVPDLKGTISGNFHLTLPSGKWEEAHGHGNVKMVNGLIIKAPTLAAFFLGDPGTKSGEDRGAAQFTIKKGAFHFPRIVIDNASWYVVAKGLIHTDGRLDIQVSPFAKLDHFRVIPGLGDITRFIIGDVSGRLARFDITGHISAPLVESDPF